MDDKPVALTILTSPPATKLPTDSPPPSDPTPSSSPLTAAARSVDFDGEDELGKKAIGRADSDEDKPAVASGGRWRLRNLDDGGAGKATDEEPSRRRRRRTWLDRLLRRHRPPPPAASASLDDADLTPLATASFLSLLTFSWITPMMDLGYRRTLQATDLWKMDPSRESGPLANSLLAAFARRQADAEAFNVRLDAGEVNPPLLTRVRWLFAGRAGRETRETAWRSGKGRRKASLAWCLNEDVALFFWTGGLFKVAGDTAQLCGPLVTRQIILFAQVRARAREDPTNAVPEPHIGRGVGMAFGLLILTIVASVCQHQFFWRSMSVGVLARARLTAAIFDISIHLTQKERTHLSNGKLLAHLSTDVSRVDFCAQWLHAVWTAPIQLVITTILLVLQIGPSALVGISLFLLLTPVQTRIMGMQFQVRKRSMRFTDGRSRLLQELLGSFAIVKYFTLERPFLERIGSIRSSELQGIRSILLIKAANQSIAMSLPTLAAVVSFLCYAGLGNDLDPASIFTALSLFQLLRQPLMFLPRALSAIADAQNALERLTVVFEAETLAVANAVDPALDVGIRVANGSFEWLAAPPEEESAAKGDRKARKKAKQQAAAAPAVSEEKASVEPAIEPFRVQGINMEVKRGAITVLAGRVGSGKSSILQGLIGDMKKIEGKVEFGGRVAYCSQTAFIQNASLRENVLFGRPYEAERYWQCMADACLIADCLTLPDADLTEIGEKGVNLSGGQKQRVNIARALYFDAEIVIFDDPLSAVDAAVSQALFQDAICARLRNANVAVLLVTHALHILPEVDYIYSVEAGRIVEEGTFPELMSAKGAFSELVREFGGDHVDESEADKALAAEALARDNKLRRAEAVGKSAAVSGTGRLEGRLIVAEKRYVGKVKRRVYVEYSRAGRGLVTLPLLLGAAFLMQGCLVLSSVWLTWWQGDHFGFSQGEYMGIYATLGVSQALFTFAMGATMAIISFNASGRLHHAAVSRLFFAPLSLFQSQPLGRLMSVVGKDCDTIDNVLADSLRMAIMTTANVLGSVVLICIFLPYFLIAVVVLLFGYFWLQSFYRRSAREIKRIDALLRSVLYSHFSESLSGLSTIRAYDVVAAFVAENRHYMDLESRALQLTVVAQRWLAIRLDSLGAILSFVVGLLCVIGVNGISPAQVGLVLSFCITLTQQLGMVTRQTAEVETNMNAVERVVHYNDLEQEAAYEVPTKKPPSSWPTDGQIEFNEVVMAYRLDLPPVLKGFSLNVRGGEKIGIVGRTGAGKSTLMSALFRLVELTSGSISIDGVDISSLGLSDLRSAVTIIPQDPQLFSGTVRSNLDPFLRLSDADLWSALRRAHLVTSTHDDGKTAEKFGLDSDVDEDGANFSVGQRSLLSLARALCKDAKIIVLDEATASVDAASDAQIQQTIASEFADKTVLTIAHRLRTILHCDRILCLNAGVIAELGTPLELFRQDGLFRAMALKSNLSEADFCP